MQNGISATLGLQCSQDSISFSARRIASASTVIKVMLGLASSSSPSKPLSEFGFFEKGRTMRVLKLNFDR
jgi:hypothetical protein